jgi:hypothetical protein
LKIFSELPSLKKMGQLPSSSKQEERSFYILSMASKPLFFRLLIEACKRHDKKKFISHMHVLHADGVVPRDGDGNTTAHYCYKYNYVEGVKLLMENGHDTHLLNRNSDSPLNLAVYNKHYDLVRWHLDHNSKEVEYSIKDILYEYTPSMWLVHHGEMALLHEFVRRGYVDPDAEQSFFFRDSHFTLAIQEEHFEIALYLLKNGLQGRNGLARIQKLFIERQLLCKMSRPEEMLRFLDKIGMAHIVATETVENGVIPPLTWFINRYRFHTKVMVFLALAKRGYIKAYMLRQIISTQNVEYRDLCSLKEVLSVEVQIYENFKSGFLPLTAKVHDLPRRRIETAKTLLESFDAGINQLVADFVGVPYGEILTHMKVMIIMITLHLHS